MAEPADFDLSSKNAEPASQVNILLVDDEPANLLVLRVLLEDLAANLIEARGGVEALYHLQDCEFAVILLDVQMRGIDGLETARQIRGQERHRHTPIIFITAYNEPGIVEPAYQSVEKWGDLVAITVQLAELVDEGNWPRSHRYGCPQPIEPPWCDSNVVQRC